MFPLKSSFKGDIDTDVDIYIYIDIDMDVEVDIYLAPSNVPLLRAFWCLVDGIRGLLKGSWGVLDIQYCRPTFLIWLEYPLPQP